MREHLLTRPWVKGETIEIFARECFTNPAAPGLIYFQGGPGFPSPRPVDNSGWLAAATKKYRVFLLDQRGTGRSTRIDATTPQLIDAAHLSTLRADQIVEDAEALREHLGLKRWAAYGQSFGGFCITTYLSRYPERISRALFTGGLPGIDQSAEDVYRDTFAALARRERTFFREFPWAKQRIRDICTHLDNHDERLPTGERLSSQRFRTIGIELGRTYGLRTLAYLLEAPFTSYRGEHRLRGDFLNDVAQRVSFASAPLYAAMHESIYGGNQPGATRWAASRVREEYETELTGEHIFPWQFEEDPALVPFREVAEELAQREQWPALYNPEVLAEVDIPAAAAVYVEDMFVPREASLELAELIGVKTWITNEYQHDGIRCDGERIFTRLDELAGER